MRILDWLRLRPSETVFEPSCVLCGRPSATIRITSQAEGFVLIYDGPGGSSGSSGVPITRARYEAITAAFVEPFTITKIRAAEFYDDAGFCGLCGCFYCPTHWNISATGGGTCPKGHFKSLDPHWSPE